MRRLAQLTRAALMVAAAALPACGPSSTPPDGNVHGLDDPAGLHDIAVGATLPGLVFDGVSASGEPTTIHTRDFHDPTDDGLLLIPLDGLCGRLLRFVRLCLPLIRGGGLGLLVYEQLSSHNLTLTPKTTAAASFLHLRGEARAGEASGELSDEPAAASPARPAPAFATLRGAFGFTEWSNPR